MLSDKSKKNFKVVSPKEQGLPELTDTQVEKLFSLYKSMDKNYKLFVGTKREYVLKVAELVNKFIVSNTEDLVGSGRKTDAKIALIEKLGKKIFDIEDQEYIKRRVTSKSDNTSRINSLLDSVKKYKKEIDDPTTLLKVNNFITSLEELKKYREQRPAEREKYIREKAKFLFPEEQEIFNPEKENTILSEPKANPKTGEYYETLTKTSAKNPFHRFEGSIWSDFKGTAKEKYDQMVAQGVLYRKVLKAFAGDQTAYTNFFIALPFDKLFELTPEGVKQRKNLNNLLINAGRPTNAGVLRQTESNEWTEKTEGSYRTELFVFDKYLSNNSKLNGKQKLIERAKALGKIYSLDMSNTRLDYDYKNIKADSKGKLTLISGGEVSNPQANLDKMCALILASYNSSKESFGDSELLFTYYYANSSINDYDSEKPDSKTFIQAVYKFDIKGMLDSKEKNVKKAVTQLKATLNGFKNLTPIEKSKVIESNKMATAVSDVLKKYMSTFDIDQGQYLKPKPNTEGELSKTTKKKDPTKIEKLQTVDIGFKSLFDFNIANPIISNVVKPVIVARPLLLNPDKTSYKVDSSGAPTMSAYQLALTMKASDPTIRNNEQARLAFESECEKYNINKTAWAQFKQVGAKYDDYATLKAKPLEFDTKADDIKITIEGENTLNDIKNFCSEKGIPVPEYENNDKSIFQAKEKLLKNPEYKAEFVKQNRDIRANDILTPLNKLKATALATLDLYKGYSSRLSKIDLTSNEEIEKKYNDIISSKVYATKYPEKIAELLKIKADKVKVKPPPLPITKSPLTPKAKTVSDANNILISKLAFTFDDPDINALVNDIFDFYSDNNDHSLADLLVMFNNLKTSKNVRAAHAFVLALPPT